MSLKQVNVAIGLIVQGGKILVGWRDENLHQGGCYEFPGGKIEANETVEQAVQREIKEEVGVNVRVIRRFHELVHEYPDRIVHLYFCTCIADDLEGLYQGWQWVNFDQLQTLPFPEANKVILKRLDWKRAIAISPEFEKLSGQKIKPMIQCCYLRVEDTQCEQAIERLQQQGYDGQYIIKRDAFLNAPELFEPSIFAVHLNSKQLYEEENLNRFKNINVIAACHTPQDIKQANRLGCDAIFLSPVQATTTHPEYAPLGWEKFQLWAEQANMPVYALGGMQLNDLELAQRSAAYGVAGIGDFWQAEN